ERLTNEPPSASASNPLVSTSMPVTSFTDLRYSACVRRHARAGSAAAAGWGAAEGRLPCASGIPGTVSPFDFEILPVQAPARASAPATIGKRIERGRFIGSPAHVWPSDQASQIADWRRQQRVERAQETASRVPASIF